MSEKTEFLRVALFDPRPFIQTKEDTQHYRMEIDCLISGDLSLSLLKKMSRAAGYPLYTLNAAVSPPAPGDSRPFATPLHDILFKKWESFITILPLSEPKNCHVVTDKNHPKRQRGKEEDKVSTYQIRIKSANVISADDDDTTQIVRAIEDPLNYITEGISRIKEEKIAGTIDMAKALWACRNEINITSMYHQMKLKLGRVGNP